MRIVLVPNLNLAGLHTGTGEPVLDDLTPPLGVLSLAAVVEQLGHQVSIVDFNYEVLAGRIELGPDFYRQAVESLLCRKAEIYGFSTMCNSMHIALRLAERLRAVKPDSIILFGGPQVSFVPKETLEAFPFVDYVLRGEAEESIVHLIDHIIGSRPPESVSGLTYRLPLDRDVIHNPPAPVIEDLDGLPYPAWHLFEHDIQDSPSIDVGRGCPFSCSFCSTSIFFRRRFRLKSFERIIGEMHFLKEKYGAKTVNFVHDLFTANKKWVRAFCERLGEEPGLHLKWAASARIDTVDPSLLETMASVGCHGLFYGVESGSPRMQQVIGKRLKVDNVVPIAQAAIGSDIRCTMSFIAGFPLELESDLRESFRLIEDLLTYPKVDVQLHLMSPQSGTADIALSREKLRLDEYYSDITSSPPVFLEPEWFRRHPDLFPSFYYFELEDLDRSTLRGIDQFVRLPCTVLRRTVLGLVSGPADLWDLYLAWTSWAALNLPTNTDGNSVQPDSFLFGFIEFAGSLQPEDGWRFEPALARDELLAFFLLRYHGISAVWEVEPGAVAEFTQATTRQLAELRG